MEVKNLVGVSLYLLLGFTDTYETAAQAEGSLEVAEGSLEGSLQAAEEPQEAAEGSLKAVRVVREPAHVTTPSSNAHQVGRQSSIG